VRASIAERRLLVVLRDMRRAAEFATAGDKIGGVKVLVATHGAATSDIVLDHAERGGTLCRAVGLGQSRIDDERVAVLHRQMPHVAELGLLAGGFAEQRASASVVEECVSFLRFSPWKSRSVSRPPRWPRPLPEAGIAQYRSSGLAANRPRPTSTTQVLVHMPRTDSAAAAGAFRS
jgi:hypothetical protein